jgi:hypothetical protein
MTKILDVILGSDLSIWRWEFLLFVLGKFIAG